ncbi:MAG TPA: indolepyruvate ferredoxin oxidoreductase family protein [Ilumatobacteraceae bacterium]|nr:indolepyruvate ferredoxin oxidoreductase family protein [Ilumatobacteraceae bacterium]HRB02034.1 indolepyruvate ferredoxin oxidoreductase family protein [Ilumatobacteraceae bacterium]
MDRVAVIDTYELADRYRIDEGRAFISGSQALARLPYEQLRADRRAGLETAAYISGYPGSPLASYDRDVSAAAALATADGLHMVFQPGLNEELAATAVMGSQLAVTLESCRYDGIIGIWYGKAPGLDRASDALRHAVFAGTSDKGGAVALIGDDPAAKSSTLPSSSGATLVDLNMPIIYPGDVQEAIDLGRHAIALSRACGVWASIKVVEAVADGTGSVELHHERIAPVIPTMEVDGKLWVPRPNRQIITPFTVDIEREFHEVRLELARQYGVLNQLNTIAARGPADWVGIVASGHTYHETLEALRQLGFRTPGQLSDAGIRLFKLGMPVPLDAAQVREFAVGLQEVIVVEEKTQHLEWLVKDALCGRVDAPLVHGKHGPNDARLFPMAGTLEADSIATHLRSRLSSRLADRMAPAPPAPRQLIPLSVSRTPYFCSGCPHNSSTKVPDGSLVGAGIGCHSMVMMMEPGRAGDIVGLTSMGNEGAQWFGMSPFVDDEHLIQNLGDGTLFHSGMTAIRGAIANGANITYKILYNGTVAMTGGQDPFGQLDVPTLCKVLQAQGARRIIVTTDELDRYRGIELPIGVKVWGRNRLIEAQEVLATVPGCTILIHDQRCAAEKRRDRKRDRIGTPSFRVVINERVCEGCGDCGDTSNCLSVQPTDTAFGRKTRIDQGSCNFDFSCTKGDCPAFMTVTVAPEKSRSKSITMPTPPTDLPAPPAAAPGDCTIRMSGIGGTGVVTASQIVGTAAMLGGYQVRGLDQTGLSQKAGPVVSDLRLSLDVPQPSNKATAGSVDVLLAFDQLVGGNDATLRTLSSDRTVVVVNSAKVATGSMVVHPDRPFPLGEVSHRLDDNSRDRIRVDAQQLVVRLLGDDSTVNVFVIGVAVQAGLVPVAPDLIERAIMLNGVAVEKNLAAFAWGRAWFAEPEATAAAAGISTPADEQPSLERFGNDLVDYQSAAYAARYRSVVERVAALGHDDLTDAVTRNLYKLMAYKDEYEVARLLLLPESRALARSVGGTRTRVTWLLHPPALRSLGWRNKIHLGRSSTPVFWVLRSMRRLRGTPIDVFGWAHVRRVERAMIPEYIAAIDALLPLVDAGNLAEIVAIAELPDKVRGYEHLKMERATAYRAELGRRVARWASLSKPTHDS